MYHKALSITFLYTISVPVKIGYMQSLTVQCTFVFHKSQRDPESLDHYTEKFDFTSFIYTLYLKCS